MGFQTNTKVEVEAEASIGSSNKSSKAAKKPKPKKKPKGPKPKRGVQQTSKAKANDNGSKSAKKPRAKNNKSKRTDPSKVKGSATNHVFAFYYKRGAGNKIKSIRGKLYIPYIEFELSFNCFPKKSKASKHNAAKANYGTANRKERRGVRTRITEEYNSGYLAKKRKKAGTRKAARTEQFLLKASKPSICLSNHAIQRYRERGLNTFPIIKYGDRNASSDSIVATFVPKVPSLQLFRSTRDVLLPFVQHDYSKDLPTRKRTKAPKEIESIFAYSKNAIKKIEVERCRMQREKAYYKRR
eukprot:scaffold116435_cov47-Attheya_sp.AAC.2